MLQTLYRFNLGLCESLMQDIEQGEMLHQPAPGVNPPAWILGHLAIVNDFALEMLGAAKRCPAAWGALFGPQSDPSAIDPEACPTKEELLTEIRDGFAATCELLPGADLTAMTEPNPIVPLRGALPTTGDLLAHILSTHAAGHLGHLSNWRRQMGRPPLF